MFSSPEAEVSNPNPPESKGYTSHRKKEDLKLKECIKRQFQKTELSNLRIESS